MRNTLAKGLEEVSFILNRSAIGRTVICRDRGAVGRQEFGDVLQGQPVPGDGASGAHSALALQLDVEGLLDDIDQRLDGSLDERIEAVKAGTLYGEDEVKAWHG